MTRVRVPLTNIFLLSLIAFLTAWIAAADNAPKWTFQDQLRVGQTLDGGSKILGGQVSLAEGSCPQRPQALVQMRAADDSVIWERAAKAAPERGAAPLFMDLGEIDPRWITLSTVHAIAREPHKGDVFVAGDLLVSWLGVDGGSRTARGGFVVRLTPHGSPIAEAYFGVRPDGPPLREPTANGPCAHEVCTARPTQDPITVSLREMSVSSKGEVWIRGFERRDGVSRPFLTLMSEDLKQTKWSGTDSALTAKLPSLLLRVDAGPVLDAIPLDRHQQAPDRFEVLTGLLDEGGLVELGASDNQRLAIFAQIQDEDTSLGEIMTFFDLVPEMPVIEKVTAEVYVEHCAQVTITLGGGNLGSDVVDIASRRLRPFDEPVIEIPISEELANQLGFGPGSHSAAGEEPARVGIRFDVVREPSQCPSGAQCASQGEANGVDQVILTTEYP